MNFARRRTTRGPMVIPRLPLVAFVDVVLFLLLYFVYVADVTPEERVLGAALRTDTRGPAATSGLVPQILIVESEGGKVRYRMGDRVMASRSELDGLLSALPKDAGLVVKVKGDVPVSAAAGAIAAGRGVGFTKISYVPMQ